LSRKNYLSSNQASMIEIAKRIHKLFRYTKIIVTFRNKGEWLKSLYKIYLRSREFKEFDDWYNNVFK